MQYPKTMIGYSVRSLFALLLVTYAYSAHAQNSFRLNANETISDALYYRLKISPIYGNNGYLKRVLDLNNLDERSAHSLRPGREIQLPNDVIDPDEVLSESIVENDPNKSEALELSGEPKPISMQVIVRTYVQGTLVYNYLYGAQENGDSSFKTHLVRPEFSAGIIRESQKTILKAHVGVAPQILAQDEARKGSGFMWLGVMEAAALYKFDAYFKRGVHVRYKQSLFMLPEGEEAYRIHRPWIATFGPRLEIGDKHIGGISVLYKPHQNVTGPTHTVGDFDVVMNYQHQLKPDRFLVLNSEYNNQKNNLEEARSFLIETGFRMMFQ